MFRKSIKHKRDRFFLSRILLSPLKLINTIFVIISYRLRLIESLGSPVVLDIEPTNACNFRCPHCQVTSADWAKKNMSADQFNKIIDTFPHALRVKLQGMGEPFLNKNLIEFIDKTCSKKYWCEVTSNGSLFDKRPIKDLAKYKNFQLTISIDAHNKELFEKIRPGSDFNKIINNVKDLQVATNMDLSAWMVVDKDNESSVVDTIKLVKSLNISIFGLQIIVVDYAKEALRSETVEKRINLDNRSSLYSDWRKQAKNRNVELDIADTLYDKSHPCPWPWQGTYIDVVGNVVPCCRIGDARVSCMGNINKTPFEKIWNSKEYKEFRALHKNNKIPKICSSCYKN